MTNVMSLVISTWGQMASCLAAQWARMLDTSLVSLGLSTQLLAPLTVPSQSSLYLEVPSPEVSTRPGSHSRVTIYRRKT